MSSTPPLLQYSDDDEDAMQQEGDGEAEDAMQQEDDGEGGGDDEQRRAPLLCLAADAPHDLSKDASGTLEQRTALLLMQLKDMQ